MVFPGWIVWLPLTLLLLERWMRGCCQGRFCQPEAVKGLHSGRQKRQPLPPASLLISLLPSLTVFPSIFGLGQVFHDITFSSSTAALTCCSRFSLFPLPRMCDCFSACAFKGVGNIVCLWLTPCISPRCFVQLLMNF